ncbi:hypothetical protein BGX34_008411 [Mortierella sp. NVP85]|nr:hypothetical protein BGX34_008411 [Mortierella sp. NVP85]
MKRGFPFTFVSTVKYEEVNLVEVEKNIHQAGVPVVTCPKDRKKWRNQVFSFKSLLEGHGDDGKDTISSLATRHTYLMFAEMMIEIMSQSSGVLISRRLKTRSALYQSMIQSIQNSRDGDLGYVLYAKDLS